MPNVKTQRLYLSKGPREWQSVITRKCPGETRYRGEGVEESDEDDDRNGNNKDGGGGLGTCS